MNVKDKNYSEAKNDTKKFYSCTEFQTILENLRKYIKLTALYSIMQFF